MVYVVHIFLTFGMHCGLSQGLKKMAAARVFGSSRTSSGNSGNKGRLRQGSVCILVGVADSRSQNNLVTGIAGLGRMDEQRTVAAMLGRWYCSRW